MSLRLTRPGRYWLGMLAVVLAVGILKNINLLTLLGYTLLALLAAAGVAAGRRLRFLEARRVLEETLFADTPLHLEVRVHNPTPHRITNVRLDDAGPHHAATWFLPTLPARSRHVASTEILLPKRGPYDLPPITASSTAPFGLWERRLPLGPASKVCVLPRPGKISRERLRHYLKAADPHGERVHRHGWRHETAQADFHGLRPFRPGDSPRWIHWRTSARRGELMVREFEDVPGDDLVLVLDPTSDLEAVITLAATIIWEWNHRRGDHFALGVAGPTPQLLDGITGPEHARQLLECLAVLAPTDAPADNTFTLSANQVPHSAAVVVVAAGDTGLSADLERQLNRPAALLTPDALQHGGIYTPP